MNDLFDDKHLRYYYEEFGKVGHVTLYARSLVGYPASAKYFHSLRDKVSDVSVDRISPRKLLNGGVKLQTTSHGVYATGDNVLWNPLNNVDQAMRVCFAFGMSIQRHSRGRLAVSMGDRIAVASYADFNDTTRIRNQADHVVWGKMLCHAVVALGSYMTVSNPLEDK